MSPPTAWTVSIRDGGLLRAPSRLWGTTRANLEARATGLRLFLQAWGRPLLVLGGAAVFAVGLLIFGGVQTQPMFRASDWSAIRPGSAGRNDGGILFAAILSAAGLAAFVAGLSRRTPRGRVLPAMGLGAAAAALLVMHFSIFVNGLIMEAQQRVVVEASFLLHDAARFPIAVFSLALLTLVIALLGVSCCVALLAPETWRDRVLRPEAHAELRMRLLLSTVLLLIAGGTYAYQFFRFAIFARGDPSGGFISVNLVGVYYALGGLLALALALAALRTSTMLWGRQRVRSGARFRRQTRRLLWSETVLWGIIGVLTLLALGGAAIYRPEDEYASRVFTTDSRGATFFFLLLVPALYALHRVSAHAFAAHLHKTRRHARNVGPDSCLALGLLIGATWILAPLVVRNSGDAPLIVNILRMGIITVLLYAFAIRVDANSHSVLQARRPDAPLLFILASATSIVTGIMLWGAGNSVLLVWSQGVFLTPEGQFLQPYTVLLRLAGALFIALPPLLGFWLLAAQRPRPVQTGHLITLGIGIMLAMTLLFTIQPADPIDPELGQNNVRVGFYLMQITSAFDALFLGVLWAAAMTLVILSTIRIYLSLHTTRFWPQTKKRSKLLAVAS